MVSAILGTSSAQIYKLIYYFFKDKKLNLKKLITSGGMPSAHSAMVMGLTTAIGIQEGWSSAAFCIAAVFSLIVIYDAAGVRRSVGMQAIVLNDLTKELLNKESDEERDRLSELLGHTPIEVVMGAILGIGIAFCLHFSLN